MASLDVELLGAKQLYELGRKLRESPKKVQSATRRQLTKVVRPLEDEIRDEIEPTMPKGYEPVLSKSLKFRIDIRSTYWSALTLSARAPGQKKGRDIRALDVGLLRHPVYGRYRRTKSGRIKNPWAVQVIKPGFWSRPIRNSAPRIRRELTQVIASELRKATQGVS